MKYIIDTNCLYYLAEISNPGYTNWKLIKSEILSRDIYLSLWSLVELITNDDFSDTDKNKAYEYIVNSKLRVIPMGITNSFTNIIPINLAILSDKIPQKNIKELVLSEKKDHEQTLLRYTITIGGTIFYMALFYKLTDDGANEAALNAFSFLCLHLINGNTDYLLDKSKEIIDKDYSGAKDSVVGSEIADVLNTVLFIMSVFHDSVIEGSPFDLFPDLKSKLPSDQIASLPKIIASDRIMEELVEKVNNPDQTKLNKIIDIKYFNRAIKDSIIELQNTIPVGVISFSLYLIQKCFFENRKIIKNDMIDSMLFELYPEFKIITFDKKMKAIIERFDKKMFEDNQTLLDLK